MIINEYKEYIERKNEAAEAKENFNEARKALEVFARELVAIATEGVKPDETKLAEINAKISGLTTALEGLQKANLSEAVQAPIIDQLEILKSEREMVVSSSSMNLKMRDDLVSDLSEILASYSKREEEYLQAFGTLGNIKAKIDTIDTATIKDRLVEVDKGIVAIEAARAYIGEDTADAQLDELNAEKAELEELLELVGAEPVEAEEEADDDAEATDDDAEEDKIDEVESSIIKGAKVYLENVVLAGLDSFPQFSYGRYWADEFKTSVLDELTSWDMNLLIDFLQSEEATTIKISSSIYNAVIEYIEDEEKRESLRYAERLKAEAVGRMPIRYKDIEEYDSVVAQYLEAYIKGEDLAKFKESKYLHFAD